MTGCGCDVYMGMLGLGVEACKMFTFLSHAGLTCSVFFSELILLKEFLHLFSYSNSRFVIERVLFSLGAACKLQSLTHMHIVVCFRHMYVILEIFIYNKKYHS